MPSAPPWRTEANPQPADTWRVRGRPYSDRPGHGCTCSPYGPDWHQVHRALTRLNETRDPSSDRTGSGTPAVAAGRRHGG